MKETFRPLLQEQSFAAISFFCFVTAGGEELAFRGFVQGAVGRFFGDDCGVVVGSLVFGYMHAYNLMYVVLATFAGSLFGCLFVKGGSIIAPFTVHFVYDFAAIVLLRLQWALGDVEAAGGALAVEALRCFDQDGEQDGRS